jgi:hypothetical protein
MTSDFVRTAISSRPLIGTAQRFMMVGAQVVLQLAML